MCSDEVLVEDTKLRVAFELNVRPLSAISTLAKRINASEREVIEALNSIYETTDAFTRSRIETVKRLG